MSYCRWSSSDFKCDLYCYESFDGYVTHVAGMRLVGEIPVIPPLEDPGWAEAFSKQMAFVKDAPRVPIGLPYDGKSYHDKSLKKFLRRIKMLKEAGYNVPDSLISDIEAEIIEKTTREAAEDAEEL